MRERLARQAPDGLEILSLRPASTSRPAPSPLLTYRIALPADRIAGGGLARAADSAGRLRKTHQTRTRPAPRRVDLRPWMVNLRMWSVVGTVSSTAPPRTKSSARMELCLNPAGTARPEEVLAALGLSDLLEAGAVLERSRLQLMDEELFFSPSSVEGYA